MNDFRRHEILRQIKDPHKLTYKVGKFVIDSISESNRKNAAGGIQIKAKLWGSASAERVALEIDGANHCTQIGHVQEVLKSLNASCKLNLPVDLYTVRIKEWEEETGNQIFLPEGAQLGEIKETKQIKPTKESS